MEAAPSSMAEPWKTEPNRLAFQDEDSGYECLILRTPFGSWNGYVLLPRSHKFFGKESDDEIFCDIKVHGGITFAGGHPLFEFAIGFDCSHLEDLCPIELSFPKSSAVLSQFEMKKIYRTMDFAKAECISLARQLRDLALYGNNNDKIIDHGDEVIRKRSRSPEPSEDVQPEVEPAAPASALGGLGALMQMLARTMPPPSARSTLTRGAVVDYSSDAKMTGACAENHTKCVFEIENQMFQDMQQHAQQLGLTPQQLVVQAVQEYMAKK